MRLVTDLSDEALHWRVMPEPETTSSKFAEVFDSSRVFWPVLWANKWLRKVSFLYSLSDKVGRFRTKNYGSIN